MNLLFQIFVLLGFCHLCFRLSLILFLYIINAEKVDNGFGSNSCLRGSVRYRLKRLFILCREVIRI